MLDMASEITAPITFRFKHLGPLQDAKLQLGNLTIIAGCNNTGKTYMAYTLYGFLKMWKSWAHFDSFMEENKKIGNSPSAQFPDFHNLAQTLLHESHVHFIMDQKTLARQRKTLSQEIARAFSKQALSSVFSSHSDDFERASIAVESNSSSPYSDGIDYLYGDILVSIKRNGPKIEIAIDLKATKPNIEFLYSTVRYFYFRWLLENEFPEPFILSAERFGISLFFRELDFTKNQLVDILQKLGNDDKNKISPYIFIDKTTSRYALPIKDNIDYTRSIPERRKNKSEIYDNKLFDNIKDMMGGYYQSSSEDIHFISKARKSNKKFKIPLHLASSSARGVSDLYFFLRHVAEKNHLVIIDEPESHLDTRNQIFLARLLASLVRAGLKVLITTHSDYLIKEINNLIMLSSPFAEKNEVVKNLKYNLDDFLKPCWIRAYIAEENQLKPCQVDKFGIDMPMFDKTIDDINRTANELASKLSEEVDA